MLCMSINRLLEYCIARMLHNSIVFKILRGWGGMGEKEGVKNKRQPKIVGFCPQSLHGLFSDDMV